MFSPSDETVEVVRGWLIGAGIARERITHSDNQGWLAFDASTDELEELVVADFHGWEHTGTGRVTAAADQYVHVSLALMSLCIVSNVLRAASSAVCLVDPSFVMSFFTGPFSCPISVLMVFGAAYVSCLDMRVTDVSRSVLRILRMKCTSVYAASGFWPLSKLRRRFFVRRTGLRSRT